jgi:tetratricopeptide (TPR) repeat protein
MPKTVAGIRFENVMPKEVRGNITQLRLAESAGEWERVKKYSKSLTEHFLDVCDSSKAIDYADKFEKCTLKLTGKPSFESNDLFYKASVLSGHAKTTIQYGERILGQIRDQEELYELYVTLGNAYIRRYENLELQPNLLDSAYAYFLKAAKMLKKEDKSKRGHLLLNMGIYYRHKKENANAITNFERAFNIGKETRILN